MAKFIDVTNISYTGKEAEEIFVKDLYASDLKGYGIRYMPNVKGRQKLVSGEVGDMFQAYTCPFSPDGSVKLSESFIEAKPIKVNLENCYDEFWNTFLADQTEVTLNGGIPQAFFDWFFNNVLKAELAKEYEAIFWNGDEAYAGDTKKYLKTANGIVKQLTESGKYVNVAGAALTTANILAKIGEVAMAVSELEDVLVDDYKIFVNYMDYRKMKTALGAEGIHTTLAFSNFTKEGDKIYAYGFEVVPTRLEKNVIIASHPANLVLGYDVENSETEYKIVDMRESTLDNTFRVAVLTNIAAGVVYPEAVVMAKA